MIIHIIKTIIKQNKQTSFRSHFGSSCAWTLLFLTRSWVVGGAFWTTWLVVGRRRRARLPWRLRKGSKKSASSSLTKQRILKLNASVADRVLKGSRAASTSSSKAKQSAGMKAKKSADLKVKGSRAASSSSIAKVCKLCLVRFRKGDKIMPTVRAHRSCYAKKTNLLRRVAYKSKKAFFCVYVSKIKINTLLHFLIIWVHEHIYIYIR